MTKNIIVIGCSFSKAFTKPGDDLKISWPEYLAKKTGYNVENYAQYINSVPNQWHILEYLLDNSSKKIDAVIVQLTLSSRLTLVDDWLSYVKNHKLTNKTSQWRLKNYWEFKDDHISINKNKWNSIGAAHLNGVVRNIEWNNLYNTLYRHAVSNVGMFSDNHCVLIEEEIRRMVENKGIQCILYKHDYPQKNLRGLTKNKSNANNKKWIELYNRRRNNLDFILQYDMNNFKNFLIDDGYHFAFDGNTKIVEDFIIPRLEANLNHVQI